MSDAETACPCNCHTDWWKEDGHQEHADHAECCRELQEHEDWCETNLIQRLNAALDYHERRARFWKGMFYSVGIVTFAALIGIIGMCVGGK